MGWQRQPPGREDAMFATRWCSGMGTAGWLLMAGLWAGFLAVVVWAVLWLFPRGRRDFGDQQPPAGRDTATDLDRRLAAGEIGVDDYLRRRDALSGVRLPTGPSGTAERDLEPCPRRTSGCDALARTAERSW
jgi:uncharacterized membrane protein